MSIYEEDNEYIDGEEKRPKLFIILGLILLIIILLFIVISCSIKSVKKSDNNNLASLRVTNSKLSPEFNKDVTSYNVESEADVVSIYCSTESSKANTEGCNKQLDVSRGTVTYVIKVIAENKNKKEYKLYFKKNENPEVKEKISVEITSDIESETEVEKQVVLQADVTPKDSNVTYKWYENENLSYYKATTSGNYFVRVTKKDSSDYADSEIFVVKIKDENNETKNETENKTTNNSVVKINSVTGNSNKWVTEVTLYVNAYATNGLADKGYSFDGGKTYQSSNSKTFTKNGTVNIVIKDSKGKTASKTVSITKIDNTKPSVSITPNSKTNNSVILKANVSPSSTSSGYKYQWYKNGNAIKNATNSSYTASANGKYKVRVVTGSGNTSYSSEYNFTVVTVSCPTLTATTTKGKNVLPNTWYGEYVYINSGVVHMTAAALGYNGSRSVDGVEHTTVNLARGGVDAETCGQVGAGVETACERGQMTVDGVPNGVVDSVVGESAWDNDIFHYEVNLLYKAVLACHNGCVAKSHRCSEGIDDSSDRWFEGAPRYVVAGTHGVTGGYAVGIVGSSLVEEYGSSREYGHRSVGYSRRTRIKSCGGREQRGGRIERAVGENRGTFGVGSGGCVVIYIRYGAHQAVVVAGHWSH